MHQVSFIVLALISDFKTHIFYIVLPFHMAKRIKHNILVQTKAFLKTISMPNNVKGIYFFPREHKRYSDLTVTFTEASFHCEKRTVYSILNES